MIFEFEGIFLNTHVNIKVHLLDRLKNSDACEIYILLCRSL